MTETKPIRFLSKAAALAPLADDSTVELLAPRFARFVARANDSAPLGRLSTSLDAFGEILSLADALDAQYGLDGNLPLADVEQAVNAGFLAAAELAPWAQASPESAAVDELDQITLGLALFAMRHCLAISSPEPLVNALARRANSAQSKQETAAVYAMTQGLIAHVSPALASDLEQSNPERPWRLLNVNFAITAIRTGDTALMRFAFDQLNAALPAERAGFYAEALKVADQSGIVEEIRQMIAEEWRRWSSLH
jgi:hypothetical protein